MARIGKRERLGKRQGYLWLKRNAERAAAVTGPVIRTGMNRWPNNGKVNSLLNSGQASLHNHSLSSHRNKHDQGLAVPANWTWTYRDKNFPRKASKRWEDD